ncbi:CobW family GTP-binding protein [Seohaeicola nanhaiensis]|uniref:CobW family GTP-binding protein n=1 Tax=Seohaeicola nanhaiensis TaxID=1387282 RepID=A0ABV9KD24_9RHOB
MRRLVRICLPAPGAGKTTILNGVLAGAGGQRLAVLVNDFGSVNIDAALVRQRGRDVVELSNGCVCCSIGDDLGATLTAIAARPERPDRVLIEASGVAGPARIGMSAGHWPGFELDAVLVAADAETIRRRAGDRFVGQLVRNQLDIADIVLLTKTDLCEPEDVRTTEAWLHARRKGARVARISQGRVPASLLFAASICAPDYAGFALPKAQRDFVTRTWCPTEPVDLARLEAAFATLPASVHRAKGFVADAATARPALIQCVGSRTRVTPAAQGTPGVVFIAVGDPVPLEAFCAGLDAALAPLSGNRERGPTSS